MRSHIRQHKAPTSNSFSPPNCHTGKLPAAEQVKIASTWKDDRELCVGRLWRNGKQLRSLLFHPAHLRPGPRHRPQRRQFPFPSFLRFPSSFPHYPSLSLSSLSLGTTGPTRPHGSNPTQRNPRFHPTPGPHGSVRTEEQGGPSALRSVSDGARPAESQRNHFASRNARRRDRIEERKEGSRGLGLRFKADLKFSGAPTPGIIPLDRRNGSSGLLSFGSNTTN